MAPECVSVEDDFACFKLAGRVTYGLWLRIVRDANLPSRVHWVYQHPLSVDSLWLQDIGCA